MMDEETETITSAWRGPFDTEQMLRLEALHVSNQPVDAGSAKHLGRAKKVLAFLKGEDNG